MDEGMNRWIDEWKNEWMDEWMKGWMNERFYFRYSPMSLFKKAKVNGTAAAYSDVTDGLKSIYRNENLGNIYFLLVFSNYSTSFS